MLTTLRASHPAGAIAIALAVLLAEAAGAQQPTAAQQNAVRQSCRSDFQANCAGVPTGGQAAMQCLKQHAASVSQPCQQALGAIGSGTAAASSAGAPPGSPPPAATSSGQMSMRDEMMIAREACAPDFRAHCQNVRLGGGRAIACLEANAVSLSPACQRALAAAKQQK